MATCSEDSITATHTHTHTPHPGVCDSDLAARYGNTLHFFTTSQAAQDYISIMNTVRFEDPLGRQTLVYSGSYGTYLHNRILVYSPSAADANILDSPATVWFIG